MTSKQTLSSKRVRDFRKHRFKPELKSKIRPQNTGPKFVDLIGSNPFQICIKPNIRCCECLQDAVCEDPNFQADIHKITVVSLLGPSTVHTNRLSTHACRSLTVRQPFDDLTQPEITQVVFPRFTSLHMGCPLATPALTLSPVQRARSYAQLEKCCHYLHVCSLPGHNSDSAIIFVLLQ